ARRAATSDLERALARKLEDVPVQQEETREPELVDQLQLFVEPRSRLSSQQSVTWGVAKLERAIADVRELDDRRLGTVGEIGIAIAELLRQVEREPGRELCGPGNRVAIVGKALDGFRRCEQDALVVAAALEFA